MFTNAQKLSKNCPECAIVTRGGRRHNSPLHPIPVRLVQLRVEEIIPMFGVPEALLSDQGTILSHLMCNVYELL